MSVSMNKVLLEHSHTYSLTYRLWLLSHGPVSLKELQQRPCGLQRRECLLSGPLQSTFADPSVDQAG